MRARFRRVGLGSAFLVGGLVAGVTIFVAPRAESRAGTKLREASPPPLVATTTARQKLDAAACAPAVDVRVAPSPAGRLGAWLLIGPYRSSTFGAKTKPSGPDALTNPPLDFDSAHEAAIAPKLGVVDFLAPLPARAPKPKKAPPAWLLGSSGEGAIDVKAALHATETDAIAYAAGTLHVETAGRFYLLLGVDDGVRVSVDGNAVFTRDESRPERDDDDVIALDLAAGDHPIVLKLHQRDGAWSFNARLVDGQLSPPIGAYLALPGTSADDAHDLATKMSWVSVDRGVEARGYRPKLTVKFLEGAPRGVPLRVRAKLARGTTTAFDVETGEVPVDAAGVGELVVSLPPLGGADLGKIEDVDWTYELQVAGRTVKAAFFPRHVTREAIAHADHSIAALDSFAVGAWLPPESLASATHLKERLVSLVARGDGDIEAQLEEARELDAAAHAIDEKRDPYAARTGPMRRAYRSPADGELAEFGLYVPPSYRADGHRKYPLIVVLHGLNGKPMAMMRWFFGGDDPAKDQEWEDRHVAPLAPLEAFVVTPNGHGNTMYRDLGEDDVMRVLDWAAAAYPVDPNRITITGPSMGGIGTAAIAFRNPDRFAAAAPLCGYHSYFVRRDIYARPIRPWEHLLAEERSNVMWALNGEHIPLWIVHGTLDLPEANSGVLIDRYEKLNYSVIHDHPTLGHNVWQTTYENFQGATWLMKNRRDPHPQSLHFRTVRLRDADDAWMHIEELAQPDAWGEVSARVVNKSQVDISTSRVAALRLDKDGILAVFAKTSSPDDKLTVRIDGTPIAFEKDELVALHLEGKTWEKGPAVHVVPWKTHEITGPIRDAFHAPLLFVYGADDPTQTRANEEVARAWAVIRGGVSVHYPIVSDAEFFANGEALANDHALFLVGNAKSNRVVRALESSFPIKVDGDGVAIGGQHMKGKQLGAMFIRPNPKRLDRYVVVVEGVDALGTWRSLSLPDLLPDFVVYDESVAPSRGQMLLSAGMVRAGGFFQNDWSLPATIGDPLAEMLRPGAKSESDATPYLP